MNFLQKIFLPNNVTKAIHNNGGGYINPFKTIGNGLPSWLNVNGLGNVALLYETIPELNFVVDYIALNAAKIPMKLFRLNAAGESKKEVFSHPILDLINKPNYYQNYYEYAQDSFIKWLVFGTLPIVTSYPNSFNTGGYEMWINSINGLFNLPANLTEIKFKKGLQQYDLFNTRDISEIIESYKFNNAVCFDTENVTLLNDSNIKWKDNEWIVGSPQIEAIQKPLSNLANAYEARNVIVGKRGAMGILTAGASGDQGSFPLQPEDKKDLHEQWNDYGLNNNKFQIIISAKPVNWQSIGMQIKEMQILEGQKVDKYAVFDAYNFPKDLANNEEGAKYENMPAAWKKLYSDAIIPRFGTYVEAHNTALKTKENGLILKPDYSSIEALRDDETEKAELSQKQTSAIIEINNAIRTGAITPEQGYNILVNFWHIDENIAKSVINYTPVTDN